MQKISIQVQSVLYKNNTVDIERAIEALANAARIFQREQQDAAVSLCYGDASPDRVFSAKDWDMLCQKYGSILNMSYTFFGENTGTAKGHNLLAETCTEGYIMIMNPDVVVTPRIFSQLLSPFVQSSSRVGITEARQTPIEHHKAYDKATGETSWCSTACALFPVAVYREVEGFDYRSFFMYCDDLDFSWRVRLAGYKVIYVPSAPVFHSKHLNPDASWKPTAAEVYYSAEAALIMAHKWSNPKRVKELLKTFGSLPEGCVERKAIAEYQKRKTAGELPSPIDPTHEVAEFTPMGYGEYRFVLDA